MEKTNQELVKNENVDIETSEKAEEIQKKNKKLKEKLNTKKKSPILDEIEQRRVLIILVIVIMNY